ncbi:DHA2 family efflux MFS transporter permease subunit [Nesterenkonia ebinurensis]|uniref:DHA2 family efflux MFS transporter permease subunit n=1 Tax=Nesterenkonia ebinurensis TaxID=2608252 RepID=UPI001CC5D4A7|nr:DHA2 family efflux MFS transporter permease subunit [Nesterenkonia ebinurensis]
MIAGTLMIGIDMTIMNIAIPQLSQETGASLPVIQWTVTGYTLALAGAVPATAWVISRFSARRVFLTTLGIFTAGSALVAFSWNVESLIAFRVLQGLGGGFVLPAAMTIALSSTPQADRGRVMAILGLPVLVGPVLGPVLGGVLIDTLSWRWMFLLNVPVGVLGLALALRNLPRLPSGPVPLLDVRGLLLLPPAMALLVLGTSFAEDNHMIWMVLTLSTGLVLTAVFFRHAQRSAMPLLDVRLLRRRLTGAGTIILFLFSSGYTASMVLLPIYWQVVRGESATATGLFLAPAGLAAGIAIQISGRLIDRLPPIRVIGTGLVIATLATAVLMLLLDTETPAWQLVVLWTVIAVGAGFTIMPTTTIATRSLEGQEIPSGSTIVSLISQVSGAICVAGVSVLLAAQLVLRLPAAADGGVGSLYALPPRELTELAPEIAGALQIALCLPVILTAAATVVALITLRNVPAPQATQLPGDTDSQLSTDQDTATH